MSEESACRVGRKASITKKVTEHDVLAFTEVSGDSNPLHSDPEYAAKTRFGQRIAHGAFGLGLLSAVLGTRLVPDKTVIYLGQSVRFLRPIFLDDTVTAECEIIELKSDRPIATVACRCVNQNGEEVLKGEATIMLDPVPFVNGESSA